MREERGQPPGQLSSLCDEQSKEGSVAACHHPREDDGHIPSTSPDPETLPKIHLFATTCLFRLGPL